MLFKQLIFIVIFLSFNAFAGQIHEFAAKNNIEGIVQLFAQVNFNIDEQDDDGNTAIHIAAQHGNSELIHHLLDMQANLNIPNALGLYPIHLAMKSSQVRISGNEVPKHIRILIENGADMLTVTNINSIYYGVNVFHKLAANSDNVAILDYLLQHRPAHEITIYLNGRRSYELGMQTPLHLAYLHRNNRLAQRLIEFGADQTRIDRNGRTPVELRNSYFANREESHSIIPDQAFAAVGVALIAAMHQAK